jgi:N-acetylglucosaminyldiphosphoundecaprenol N-acetyl-beta-D-mannosaminyltransferase
MAETVDAVCELVRSGERGWLCTVNVATLMAMRRQPPLREHVEGARIVVADGQPLVWCSTLFGARLPERVAGIDLIDALCRRACADGLGIFLLGSTAPLMKNTLRLLRERHPGLRVDGADGYFSNAERKERLARIRTSGATILMVGMGSPLQERFIADNWQRLGVNVAIGVGGSFDVLGGALRRAPQWLQDAGLEWLARAAQEPRRLLPRYLRSNTEFCLLIAREIVRRWVRRLARGSTREMA